MAALPAFAQADAAGAPAASQSSSGNVEEIVVTAQKRTQSINDVGLTIQAATATTLTERGIDGPKDLGKLVPGFSYTESIYSTPVFTLRGIGLYDATFGAPPAVSVYTDQVPRNLPVMSSALDLDLERVEVLKGPQGTLFGQSSTGGAINYITAKPTDEFKAGIDLSYERFDKIEGSGFISGPITDTLKARLAFGGADGGAWQYSLSRPNDENGAVRKLQGRLTADWEPIDNLKIEASATAVRDHSDVQAPQYIGTEFNTYSAAALAKANSSAATRNPYGVVNDALYASITTPGSPNYDASFLGRQATLVSRLNGADPVYAAGARAILGTPNATGNAQAAEWTPGLLGPSHNEYYQFTLRGDYRLTDALTVTSITAFAHQILDYAQDLDATTAQDVDVPLFGSVRALNQELRLSGDMKPFNWIVGFSYDNIGSSQNNYYELSQYSGNTPIPGLAPISLTLNNFHSELKTYAGFGNVEYSVTPNLSLIAGVRYTQNNQTGDYCYNDPAIDAGQSTAAVFSALQDAFTGKSLPPIKAGQCFPLGDGLAGTTFGEPTLTPVVRHLDQHNISFRFGANYKLDQGTLLYATISQGYKTGIFSAIGASSTSQYAPAVQEKVVAYETGFKAPLLDRMLNLNGAFFYYDYTNKQVRGRVLDPIYGLLEKMVNVPESAIWGFEGELVARPYTGLSVSASATYLNSEVTSSFSKTIDGTAVYNAQGYTGDFKGSELPFTPEFSANLDAQYEWPIRNDLVAFVGGTVVYQGRQNATFQNGTLNASDFEIGAYTTLDLRAGLESDDGRWTATAYGRNVTNEFYTTAITSYLDTRFRFTGRPAIYGVSFRYRFD
jgi:outer membrane receptor protein involved in Fe transport